MTVAPVISAGSDICSFFLPFCFFLPSFYYCIAAAGHQTSCCSARRRQLCLSGVNHLNKQDEQLIKLVDALEVPHKERINMIL